jgi:hypothetical protein
MREGEPAPLSPAGRGSRTGAASAPPRRRARTSARRSTLQSCADTNVSRRAGAHRANAHGRGGVLDALLQVLQVGLQRRERGFELPAGAASRPWYADEREGWTHLVPRPHELLAVRPRHAADAEEGGLQLRGRLQRGLDLLLHGVVGVHRHISGSALVLLGLGSFQAAVLVSAKDGKKAGTRRRYSAANAVGGSGACSNDVKGR